MPRQVINNKLYDTDKAKLIYTETESSNRRQLWQMKSTQTFFFTFGNGSIEPISEEQAKAYLGLVDVSVYIEVFGEPQEG